MSYFFKNTLLFIIFFFIFANNIFADDLLSKKEKKCLDNSYKFYKKNNFSKAFSLACKKDIQELLIWLALNDKKKNNHKIALNFLENNKATISYQKITKNFISSLEKEDLNKENFKFLLAHKNSKQAFLLIINNIKEEYRGKIIKEYFLSDYFQIKDFSKYYKNYKNIFSKKVVDDKINKLIWQNHFFSAKKLLPYSSKKQRVLFKTRIAFARNHSRVALNNLKKLATAQKTNEGLFYNIVKWHEKHNRDHKVSKYLLKLENEKKPKKWANVRLRNARYLLKQKKYYTAYNVMSKHKNQEGEEFANTEWFSGWLALRFLKKPNIAIKHFRKLYNNVGFSLSRSRASYWLARSYQENKEQKKANYWYGIAGSYSTTFYGQLANKELKSNDIKFTKIIKFTPRELRKKIVKSKTLKHALYLSYLKRNKDALLFFKEYATLNNENKKDLQEVIEISKNSNSISLISNLSRYIARYNVVTINSYPILKNLPPKKASSALILSIIKQESGFNKTAISSAGAVGFMQLIPSTAKEVARRLKIPYSKRKLRNDASYNIKLGSYYIKYLLKRFDNSKILAIASYNAGANHSKRWLRENGDLRKFDNKYNVIDWIEKITFTETRNYVQRILENYYIYKELLNYLQ